MFFLCYQFHALYPEWSWFPGNPDHPCPPIFPITEELMLSVSFIAVFKMKNRYAWMEDYGSTCGRSKVQQWPHMSWGFQKVEAPRFQEHEGGKIVSLTHRPPLLTRKYSWHSFLSEVVSTLWPLSGRKDYVNEKFQWHQRESNPRLSRM